MYNFGKVGFDPGHYAGANVGPGTYREGDIMFLLADMLRLKYRVFSTRKDGKNLTLLERAKLAKAAGCNTLISLHTNAPETAKDILVIYSVLHPEDKAMAEYIGQEISKATGIPFRAAKTRPFVSDPNIDYYGMIRYPIRHGIEHPFIVEHGSHWEFAVDTEAKIKACVECYGRILGLIREETAVYKQVMLDAANIPSTVKFGSRGSDVKLLQQQFNLAGFSCGTADGIFGIKTRSAAMNFQRNCGLITDGIVGEKTWKALLTVHVVELTPGMLKAGLVSSAGSNIAKTVDNFINANFFSGKKVIGWLISKGFILNRRDNHKMYNGLYDYPKGTFIVYKDCHVEVGLKTDGQIAPIADNIQFCCQGFNLFPLDIKKEGFNPDEVGRTCNSLMMGYAGDKVLIAVREGTNAVRATETMKALGCSGAIRLDSGGSVNLWIAGKSIFKTGRVLTNIVHW